MPEDAIKYTDVSVIIPVYNSAATINRALASIAAQTILPREIIVVDDGSDDDSYQKAETWVSRLGGINLKVFKEDHQGPGATRNKGLMEATCDYVAFLDADDEWLPQKLEKSLDVLRSTNSNFVSHDYTLINKDNVTRGYCTKSFQKSDNIFTGFFLRGYISTSSVVIQRSILLEIGGFDPELPSGQDYELWLIALDSPETHFHIFEEPLMRYHITAQSISSKIELRRQCALTIAQRNFFRLDRHCRYSTWIFAMRTLIIHIQATVGFFTQSHYIEAVRTCFIAPVNFISSFFKDSQKITPRQNFLQSTHD